MTPNSIISSAQPLISVRRVRVRLRQRSLLPRALRGDVCALENLDLDLQTGEIVGVIGESGCGKSIMARTLAGGQRVASGSIRFADQELAQAGEAVWTALSRHIQLISPQSLQDVRSGAKVGRVLGVALKSLRPELTRECRAERVDKVLLRVGLSPADVKRKLKSLSPIEYQRLNIARALLPQPQVLICDELAEGLDQSEQLQIVDLLAGLRREEALAVLFITGQPELARRLCDRVMVLYLGRVMEQGECEAVFGSAVHPYTRALLASSPRVELSKRGGRRTRLLLDGERPHPSHPPMGCVFHTRCSMAEAGCVREVPHLRRTGVTPRHYAACLFAPQPRDVSASNESPL